VISKNNLHRRHCEFFLLANNLLKHMFHCFYVSIRTKVSLTKSVRVIPLLSSRTISTVIKPLISNMATTEDPPHDVVASFKQVKSKIEALTHKLNLEREPNLVAVSKTKPASMIMQVYDLGYRHFGENYVQELIDKAAILPKDISWHFIGHLQSNKAKQLLAVPNLHTIETIHSAKLATTLNSAAEHHPAVPINVMVQVNTSHEDNKNGVLREELDTVVEIILSQCKNLRLIGLMTIGLQEDQTEDFKLLVKYKHEICEKFKLNPATFELSMGMSNDYEKAIEMGSTSVRVGSTIFGHRVYIKNE